MNPNADSFAYRPSEEDGLFDSICSTCASTVGHDLSLSALAELEMQHVCDRKIVAHRTERRSGDPDVWQSFRQWLSSGVRSAHPLPQHRADRHKSQ
jgi:hypothetical protein